jgi:hypothetical protein
MITRRRLLAVCGGIIAGYAGWSYFGSSDREAFVTVVRRRLDYLKLDLEGVDAFARDMAAAHVISNGRLRFLNVVKPLYLHVPLSPRSRLGGALRHGEERVVTTYLLSSDFLINGADESRIVRYLGFYDPMRACGNPFAQF